MKKEIKIPPMGESVREVTIGKILKTSGSFVEENEEIIELETEKVNQVLFSPSRGVITWEVEEGETAVVDETIGFVESDGKKGEAPKEKKEQKQAPKEEKRQAKPPKTAPLKEEKEIVVQKPGIQGKGETRRKMSKIRKVIATRLVQSLHESAMLTTFNEVDMSQVMKIRGENKEDFLKKHGVKLGMTSFFVVGVLEALKAFPLLNSYIDGEEIVQREYFDIGVAVSSDRGLVVPVIRDCDKLSFVEIEKAIENYAKKAREGGLRIDDLEGGSFTLSNGGVFGSLLSTPILNPPQVGILGLHKIEKRAVVIEDRIEIRPMMYLALSYDHRIIDGREAILFLAKIKETIESFQNVNLK